MRVTTQDIFEAARQQGKSPALIALMNGVKPDFNMWPDVGTEMEDIVDSRESMNLLSLKGAKGSFMKTLSESVASAIQFPSSTIFMHMLGCVSTAMSHRFEVSYNGSGLHSGLYVISAQPPSTGKSAVNDILRNQVSVAFAEVNKKNGLERAKIKARIAKLNEQAKQGASSMSDAEIGGIIESIERERAKMDAFPIYRYDISDATPEALGMAAADAGGCFALTSDEATVINTALGMSYGTEGRMANNETILKGWDGGLVATVRVGRESKPFYAKGAISVIAQSETIRSILIAGERGNGLTERFLLINERSYLGERRFVDESGKSLTRPIDKGLLADYSKMVHEMVFGDPVMLTLSKQAMNILAMEKQIIEPKLANNQEYSSSLLRGVMGKMDKQVCKIAAVLHGVKEWGPGGQKRTEISAETISWAVELFSELSASFVSAAQSEGYAGSTAEMKKVADKIISMASKGKPVQFSKIYQTMRNVVPFKGSDGFTDKLKSIILPQLEKLGYIAVVDKIIHVNPKVL